VTVGTADANGAPANSIAKFKINVVPGSAINPQDDADVQFDLSITDVRRYESLDDYSGELQGLLSFKITDKLNGPSGGADAATSQEASLTFPLTCAQTSLGDVGSTCSASTTADALAPGVAEESKRAIWELGQVRLYDGGADGVASTAPNELFAVQGLFVP
jgi:hypothetical protein